MTRPVLPGTILTINCTLGYRISPGVASSMHFCSRQGNWIPDPYEVVCKGKKLSQF